MVENCAREGTPIRPEQSSAPGICFLTTFWGVEFRQLFSDLCLPSLLSPNNIPALENKRDSRLVIATPKEDWDYFKNHPIYETATKYLKIDHIDMEQPPEHLDPGERMRFASRGNKLVTEQAFRARSYAMIIGPDVIFSDGTVRTLQRCALQGYHLVLALGLRAETHGTVEALKNKGLIEPRVPLAISGQDAVQLLIQNMHSETNAYRWDEPHFARHCTSALFRVGKAGYIVHSLGWTPIFANYGLLSEHKTQALETSTIDSTYLHDNFGANARFYVVQDSDELMQLSLTREQVSSVPLSTDRRQKLPWLGHAIKLDRLRGWVTMDYFDDLRKKAFLRPVRLHVTTCDSHWVVKEQSTAALAARALRPEARLDRFRIELANAIRSSKNLFELRKAARDLSRLLRLSIADARAYLSSDRNRNRKTVDGRITVVHGISPLSEPVQLEDRIVYRRCKVPDGEILTNVTVFKSMEEYIADFFRPQSGWTLYFTGDDAALYLYAARDEQSGKLLDCSHAIDDQIARSLVSGWILLFLAVLMTPVLAGIPLVIWSLRRITAHRATFGDMNSLLKKD